METNKCHQRDGSDCSFRGRKRPRIFADLLSGKNHRLGGISREHSDRFNLNSH